MTPPTSNRRAKRQILPTDGRARTRFPVGTFTPCAQREAQAYLRKAVAYAQHGREYPACFVNALGCVAHELVVSQYQLDLAIPMLQRVLAAPMLAAASHQARWRRAVAMFNLGFCLQRTPFEQHPRPRAAQYRNARWLLESAIATATEIFGEGDPKLRPMQRELDSLPPAPGHGARLVEDPSPQSPVLNLAPVPAAARKNAVVSPSAASRERPNPPKKCDPQTVAPIVCGYRTIGGPLKAGPTHTQFFGYTLLGKRVDASVNGSYARSPKTEDRKPLNPNRYDHQSMLSTPRHSDSIPCYEDVPLSAGSTPRSTGSCVPRRAPMPSNGYAVPTIRPRNDPPSASPSPSATDSYEYVDIRGSNTPLASLGRLPPTPSNSYTIPTIKIRDASPSPSPASSPADPYEYADIQGSNTPATTFNARFAASTRSNGDSVKQATDRAIRLLSTVIACDSAEAAAVTEAAAEAASLIARAYMTSENATLRGGITPTGFNRTKIDGAVGLILAAMGGGGDRSSSAGRNDGTHGTDWADRTAYEAVQMMSSSFDEWADDVLAAHDDRVAAVHAGPGRDYEYAPIRGEPHYATRSQTANRYGSSGYEVPAFILSPQPTEPLRGMARSPGSGRNGQRFRSPYANIGSPGKKEPQGAMYAMPKIYEASFRHSVLKNRR